MREIDLIDMLYSIMKKWRIYLLVLIIGFAAFFGYSYFKDMRAYNHQMSMISTETEEYDLEELAEDKKVNVERLLYSQEYLEGRIEYSENSTYNNIDPYKVPIMEVLYKITAATDTKTNQTVLAHEKILSSSDFRAVLAEAYGIKEEYVSELYWLRQSASGQNIPVNVINIAFYGENQNQLKAVEEATDKYIKEAQPDVLNDFAPYTLEKISSSIGYTIDKGMVSNQNSVRNEVFNLEQDINTKKAALTPEELAYYEYLTGEKVEELQVTLPSKPALPIKKSVLVGIVLAIMAAFIYCMLYIFSPTLKKSERFEQLYKVNDLGSIKADNDSHKAKNPIDKLIDKIFDAYYRHNYNIESNLDLIALKLNIPAIKESGKNLAIVSTTEDNYGKAHDLESAVRQHGVRTAVFTNFMHNPEMLQSFKPEDSMVVILEEAEKSEYKEVENEIKYLNRINANILGAIMVR